MNRQGLAAASTAVPRASLRSSTVLLVSNSLDEREMYAHALGRRGYCTLQAASASDAERLALEIQPDVVVTDLQLSGSHDGVALVRILKQDPRTSHVPVIVLASYFGGSNRDFLDTSGCDALIAKPCLPDALARIVAGLIHL